jgi:hypothetical protein
MNHTLECRNLAETVQQMVEKALGGVADLTATNAIKGMFDEGKRRGAR